MSAITGGWSRSSANIGPYSFFHAAAHKHVPLMEANVAEAVLNNVLGTQNVVTLCDELRRRALRAHLDRQGRAARRA